MDKVSLFVQTHKQVTEAHEKIIEIMNQLGRGRHAGHQQIARYCAIMKQQKAVFDLVLKQMAASMPSLNGNEIKHNEPVRARSVSQERPKVVNGFFENSIFNHSKKQPRKPQDVSVPAPPKTHKVITLDGSEAKASTKDIEQYAQASSEVSQLEGDIAEKESVLSDLQARFKKRSAKAKETQAGQKQAAKIEGLKKDLEELSEKLVKAKEKTA